MICITAGHRHDAKASRWRRRGDGYAFFYLYLFLIFLNFLCTLSVKERPTHLTELPEDMRDESPGVGHGMTPGQGVTGSHAMREGVTHL